MTPSLSDRIRSRLKALGKNPSSVALEAGLGRSSVRDIILNDANPRIDTLRKLAWPLQCSIGFLTGAADDPGSPDLDTEEIEAGTQIVDIAEAGVFIGNRKPRQAHIPARHIPTHPLYPIGEWEYKQFVLLDNSLENFHIIANDVLTVARHVEQPTPLTPGALVVVMHLLKANSLIETSARFVDIIDGDITLSARANPDQFPPIRLRELSPGSKAYEDQQTLDTQKIKNAYETEEAAVLIAGEVIHISRLLSTIRE